MAYALQEWDPGLLDDTIEVVMQPTEMAQGALELTTIASTTSTASAASASGVQTAKEHRGRSSTRGRAPQRESTPEPKKKKGAKKKKGDEGSPTPTPEVASRPHTPLESTSAPSREEVRRSPRQHPASPAKGQPADASKPPSTTK